MTLTQIGRSASESEGIYLREIRPGETLDIRTKNHLYSVRYLGYGAAEISGHSQICPEPVLVNILGSTWGGSALKTGFLGVGLCLEFQHPGEQTVTRTSPIQAIIRQASESASPTLGPSRDLSPNLAASHSPNPGT
ncbi:MAG: hypothetical protein GC160_25805 [Acidobacteria bacterium]|nr:hypothetical protein [Acidobacteriota bacterium]